MSTQPPEPPGPHPQDDASPAGPDPDAGWPGVGPGPGPEQARQASPHQPYDQQLPPGSGSAGPAAAEFSQPGQADENLWVLLAHLSIPFLGFVGPLVLHLVLRDRSAWLRDNALETLNFSLLYTLVQLVGCVLVGVLVGLVLLPVVFIGGLVLGILGALAASRHELYRYPVNWRLVT